MAGISVRGARPSRDQCAPRHRFPSRADYHLHGMASTPHEHARKALLRILALCLALFVGAYVSAALLIVRTGRQSSQGTADAALVLGAAAWGNRPSPVYRERIMEAVSLYKAGRVRRIILTGGTRVAGYPSEAAVGRQFCASQGVPVADTLLDDTSRTTWQNLENARALMERGIIHTVLLVSDPLHMRRALAMAERLQIQAAPSPTVSSRFRSGASRLRFLWRESWLYLAFVTLGIKD